MPSSTSSALALAGRLRELDDAALGALLRAREIGGGRDSSIKDFFDLAERLLSRESVQAALARLDRPTLLSLFGTAAPSAVQLALADLDATAYDTVAATLAAWPTIGLPSESELAQPAPAALEPVSTADARFTDHAAAERAFGTTIAVLEIVAELWRSPARELVRGGLALPDAKRLAGAAGVGLDELPALLAVCAAAGLATLDGTEWQPGEAAALWRGGSTVERWTKLADAWFAGLPGDIRSLLGERAHSVWGEHVGDYVRWLYPASSDRMHERMSAQVRSAELLGIIANGAPSSPGSAILTGELEAATEAMGALFPAQVDKAYVQHDLSIVSPGPLEARLDTRLRELADVESSGLATTYRVTGGSINRAISAGDTADSLREFLLGISLTGIPQPLEYLIEETARRHGLVRVGTSERGSYVRSTDPNLLAAIAVDAGLAPIGLRRVGDGLESHFVPELVFWALSDARYPVAAEDARGSIQSFDRRRPAPRPAPAPDLTAALVERLRLSSTDDTAADWLERQLEAAVKGRTTVTVTVNLPSGPTEMVLEPTGIGGGRLRARDRVADIERTLPLSSIVEVRPADS